MELVIDCGAEYGSDEHDIATQLFVKKDYRSDDNDTDQSESGNESMMSSSLAMCAANLTAAYVDLYCAKNPPRTSLLSGMGWLIETLNTPGECHSQLRMSTEIFYDLHDVLVARYGLKPSLHMNTHEMLAIFLFVCAGNESNRKTQNRFKHSGETIHRKFCEVLIALMEMSKDFIRPKNPNFTTIHKRIQNDSRAYPYFKDCIGALDGTHIRVSLSPDDQVRYIGRSGLPTQNVLAVCDFDMRFTYVSTGQPWSMHDTSVLYNAIRVDESFFPHPPQGKFYVVDAGYPNLPGYLCPYKGERYHMPEWHRGMEPNTPKEKFNRVHSSIRNVIERSFGLLKMKWQILFRMPSYPMFKQKMIVVATIVLHNFIREHGGEDLDFARV
ncbi:uncharacterized protein LOC102705645 isoform X1 [Oryza brachyantha]|nr:uncharacterized protein LOC102705645 isoform X1 [Oryza brachyantha]XP_040382134.1 uncharacterized protein LOC102705645 isoform X1 [Oryza brachyantha]XP_040382135.1 uncharacterized protein LOC102705645 isoform X1 [Oryza brachyantha]